MEKYRIGKTQNKHDESGTAANCYRLNIHALNLQYKNDLKNVLKCKIFIYNKLEQCPSYTPSYTDLHSFYMNTRNVHELTQILNKRKRAKQNKYDDI